MEKKRVATATSCAVHYQKKAHERIGGDAMISKKELTLDFEQLEREDHSLVELSWFLRMEKWYLRKRMDLQAGN